MHELRGVNLPHLVVDKSHIMASEPLDIKLIHPTVVQLMAWLASNQSYPVHVFCSTPVATSIRTWVRFMLTGSTQQQSAVVIDAPLTTGLVPPMHRITDAQLCMLEADTDILEFLDTRPTHLLQQWAAATDMAAPPPPPATAAAQWQRWCDPEFQALVDAMLQTPESAASVTDVALAQFSKSQCVFAPSACVPLRDFREELARFMGSDIPLKGSNANFLDAPAVQRWLATHNVVVPEKLSNRQWQGRKVHTQFMCGVTVMVTSVPSHVIQ